MRVAALQLPADADSASRYSFFLGVVAFEMPPPGNCMGLTYVATVSPSLNASTVQIVSQTIWAGSEHVFGGPAPLVLSLATNWAVVRDETSRVRDTAGWIVSAGGTSPNNVTFRNATATTFRATVLLNRALLIC